MNIGLLSQVADELTHFVQSTESHITERHNDFAVLERRISDEVRRLTAALNVQAEARQHLDYKLGKMIEEKAGHIAHEIVKVQTAHIHSAPALLGVKARAPFIEVTALV